jgi:hypothetical protein
MPTRTDKQDALIVQAALSGFKINITNGADATKIPSKALPYTMDLKANVVGAHLRRLRRPGCFNQGTIGRIRKRIALYPWLEYG